MANIRSAKKRARQSEQARLRNLGVRSKMRTYIKKVRAAIAAKDLESAKTSFQAAVPVIDSMVNKGIIHKNTAARYKSNINKQIKQLATA
ncbi:MAG: 30S ribosomal protein S20 [Coxiellaceae bacterium]|nr:MAG: 30S ribosomal protein S20 [Coxiellaceae bacterium]